MPIIKQHAINVPNAIRRRIHARLGDWFDRNARDLPWRRSGDWYRVWVSEIMLQQTQVATVVPYFERFIARFPSVWELAAASEHDVLCLWEGLGYYRRARQMHAAAQVLVGQFQGEFPRDSQVAQKLPGIGRYTAGAILSIAFDQREPILEANTIRVLCRLVAFEGDPHSPSGRDFLWDVASHLLPRHGVGDWNQALMELGSEVCFPKNPDCSNCVLNSLCPTRKGRLQDAIPRPKKRPKFTEVVHVAVIVHHQSKVLMRQCGRDERWAGLWDFPRLELTDGEWAPDRIARFVREATGIEIRLDERWATLRHGVTRYRITLECLRATRIRGKLRPQAQWIELDRLYEYPMNTTGRKIAKMLATRIGPKSTGE